MAKKPGSEEDDDSDIEGRSFEMTQQTSSSSAATPLLHQYKPLSRDDDEESAGRISITSASTSMSTTSTATPHDDSKLIALVGLQFDQFDTRRQTMLVAAMQVSCVLLAMGMFGMLIDDKSMTKNATFAAIVGLLLAATQNPMTRFSKAIRAYLPDAFSDANYLKYKQMIAKFKDLESKTPLTLQQRNRVRSILNDLDHLLMKPGGKTPAKIENSIHDTLHLLEYLADLLTPMPKQAVDSKPNLEEAKQRADAMVKQILPAIQFLGPEDRQNVIKDFIEPLITKVVGGVESRIPAPHIFFTGPPSTGKSNLLQVLNTTFEPDVIFWQPELAAFSASNYLYQSSAPFDPNCTNLITQAVKLAKENNAKVIVIVLEELPVYLDEKQKPAKDKKDKKKQGKTNDASAQDDGEGEDDGDKLVNAMVQAQAKAKNVPLKGALLNFLGKQITNVNDSYLGLNYKIEGITVMVVATGNELFASEAIASRFSVIHFPSAKEEQIILAILQDLENTILENKRNDIHTDINTSDAAVKAQVTKLVLEYSNSKGKDEKEDTDKKQVKTKDSAKAGSDTTKAISRILSPIIIRIILYGQQIEALGMDWDQGVKATANAEDIAGLSETIKRKR